MLWAGGCLDAFTGKPTSCFSKVELLIPALLLKNALFIPLIELHLHLSEDEGCYSRAFKNQWLPFDACFILLLAITVTHKKAVKPLPAISPPHSAPADSNICTAVW